MNSIPPLPPSPWPQIPFWLSYRDKEEDNDTLVLGQKFCTCFSPSHENTLFFFFASLLIWSQYSVAERNWLLEKF